MTGPTERQPGSDPSTKGACILPTIQVLVTFAVTDSELLLDEYGDDVNQTVEAALEIALDDTDFPGVTVVDAAVTRNLTKGDSQ